MNSGTEATAMPTLTNTSTTQEFDTPIDTFTRARGGQAFPKPKLKTWWTRGNLWEAADDVCLS
ncbi:hypothetical protein GCM10027034_18110 [Ramlibacter solisilvae]